MKPPGSEAATIISQALISAANNSKSTGQWSRSLDQTLHKLVRRDSLTPLLVAQVIDPHLLHHPSLSLGFFNWAAQQPNFSHSCTTYNSVFKSLSISRQFNTLEKLLKQARSRNLPVDTTICRSVIASRIKSKKSHKAYLLLNDVASSITYAGDEICNSLLAGLVSEGHVVCARKLFDEMLVRGVSLSTLGIGLYMWRYCKTCPLDQVLGMLDKVRESGSVFNGSVVALLIIQGLCDVGKVSTAYNALVELRNRGSKPDFMAYRIVAEAFRSKGAGCIFEVQMVLKKKRKLGVAPRTSDYREFIFALISENLLWEAKELGRVIVDGNFPIEDDVLNALVGSISLVDPCSAVLFFNFMVGKESMPSRLTLKNLSRNLFKHGKIDDLLNVFSTLSSKDYFTNIESYGIMVLSLCEVGRVREAYAVLQEMRKKGLNPDVSFYNVLMKALCNEDLLRPAKKLWDEMFACGVEGNMKTYSILIKKFAETGQVDESQLLFQLMLRKGVTPDAGIYASLLEGLCQGSRVEGAIQLFYKAADQDTRIAKNLMHPLVLFLCEGGHFLAASKFLCNNCHLKHPESHAILLRYLADSKEVQTAISHLKQVTAVCPSLLREISTEILALLSSSSNPELMLLLLQEMQQDEYFSTNNSWRDFCAQSLSWVSGVTYSSQPPTQDTV